MHIEFHEISKHVSIIILGKDGSVEEQVFDMPIMQRNFYQQVSGASLLSRKTIGTSQFVNGKPA